MVRVVVVIGATGSSRGSGGERNEIQDTIPSDLFYDSAFITSNSKKLVKCSRMDN